MINRPFKTITNFPLTNMTIKIVRNETANSTNQADFFANIKVVLDQFQSATLNDVPRIIQELETSPEIDSIEVLNPQNGNGFIVPLTHVSGVTNV